MNIPDAHIEWFFMPIFGYFNNSTNKVDISHKWMRIDFMFRYDGEIEQNHCVTIRRLTDIDFGPNIRFAKNFINNIYFQIYFMFN